MKNSACILLIILCRHANAQVSNLAEQLSEPIVHESEQMQGITHFLPDGEESGTEAYLNLIPGITHSEWTAIRKHLSDYGHFLSPYELQQVDGIEPARILYFLPYLQQLGFFRHRNGSPGNEILRIGSSIRQKDINNNQNYRGSPVSWELTLQKAIRPGWKLYVKSEKDPGEKIEDVYGSVTLQYQGPGRIKTLLAGDFRAGSGQGLLYAIGSGFTGSSSPLHVIRAVAGFKPWNSWSEYGALRGLAMTVSISKYLTWECFNAVRSPDAVLTVDSLGKRYTSLRKSGLYRTESEMASRRSFIQLIAGQRLIYRRERFEFGIAGICRHNLDSVYQDAAEPYRKYSADKPYGLRAGIEWKRSWKNMIFFGEAVWGGKNNHACLTGILLSTGKKTDFSLLYRRYSRGYESGLSSAWGKLPQNSNETGFFFGVGHRLPSGWQLNGTVDLCKSPWFRYGSDLPSLYTEQMIDCSRKEKNGNTWLLRYRRRTDNFSRSSGAPLRSLISSVTESYRVQSGFKNGKSEFRTRIEYVRYQESQGTENTGFFMFHDLFVKVKTNLTMRGRIFLHACQSSGSSIYGFENDMPGRFSLQTYSGKGAGAYVMLRIRLKKEFDIWLRFAEHFSATASGRNREIQTTIQWNISKLQN